MRLVVLFALAACRAHERPGPDRSDAPTVDLPEPADPTERPVVPVEDVGTAFVVASPDRGVYAGPVTVTLTPPGGADRVVWTLDGSVPDPAAGTPYDGPIEIAPAPGQGVVVLRAAADGGPVGTWSYVFPAEVVAQPAAPPGVPGTWGVDVVTAGDYAMDPRVVDADRDGAIAGLGSLPFASLVLDPEHLWGVDAGIYMHPSEDGLEHPASLELWAADGTSVQIGCGLRVQGGSSVNGWKSDKLSLRVRFDEAYGPDELEYPVFGAGGIAKFDTLVLDAHLNLAWTHPEEYQRTQAQYVRDAYVGDLQESVGQLAPDSRFVHLYLNGLYWGIYDLHERPDDSYMAEWLGGVPSDWDVLRHDGTLVDGDAAAWQALLDLVRADELDYAAVQGLLETDAFIDYMIVNFYAGNTDWPHHNWYVARDRTGADGFRFVTWDAEHVLKGTTDDVTSPAAVEGPGEIWHALTGNAEFQAAFDARAGELLADGGLLGPAAAQALYELRIAEVESAIALESARWGDNQRPAEPYTKADWDAELGRLRSDWFPRRTAIVRGQLGLP